MTVFTRGSKRGGLAFMVAMVLLACSGEERQTVAAASRESDPDRRHRLEAEQRDWPESFGLGRAALAREIDSLDIDVRPDGVGLPAGSGTPHRGSVIYDQKCALCHGKRGVEGPYNKLVATSDDREKTIGNYWPYATTLFDYVNRSMPYNAPGSLSPDEVYSITAYLLHANRIIGPDDEMNAESLPRVTMPAQHLFITDDRRGGPEVR